MANTRTVWVEKCHQCGEFPAHVHAGEPHDRRREIMARLLAAAVMGLVNDPTGAFLPLECWEQMLPKADAILFITSDGKTPYDPINAG